MIDSTRKRGQGSIKGLIHIHIFSGAGVGSPHRCWGGSGGEGRLERRTGVNGDGTHSLSLYSLAHRLLPRGVLFPNSFALRAHLGTKALDNLGSWLCTVLVFSLDFGLQYCSASVVALGI